MPVLFSRAEYRTYPKGPNFLHVVLLASVALVLMLILAYMTLVGAGDTLVPNAQIRVQDAAHLALSALILLAA